MRWWNSWTAEDGLWPMGFSKQGLLVADCIDGQTVIARRSEKAVEFQGILKNFHSAFQVSWSYYLPKLLMISCDSDSDCIALAE